MLPHGKLEGHGYKDGVLFCTYSLLMSAKKGKNVSIKNQPKAASSSGLTPTQLAAREMAEANTQKQTLEQMTKKGTRLHQIIQWLQGEENDDPVIVLVATLRHIVF